MEFGKLELHVEQVDLTALLEEFEQEFGPVAREKGIRFRIRPIPVTVATDPQLLRRALRNLVSNAIRYTDETRPNAEVVLALRRRGASRVEIGVYDAGPGLSREDKARIFDTFYRGSAGKARPGTGFGLGLSIVKGICRELGIGLSVGSHPGRGSVFRLCLEVSEAEQVRLCSPKAVRASALGRLSGKIALVEDNAFVREALGSTLESLGAEVTDTCATCNNEENQSKRVEIKELIKKLKQVNPHVESNIFRSVENVNIDTVVAYKQNGVKHNFLDEYDNK